MEKGKILWSGVAVFALFHFMNHLYGLALPPLFPLIKEHFGVGNTETGLIRSGIALTMALFQFPLGASSDRLGRKRILALCFSVLIIATFFTSSATAFWMLILFQVILGIGLSGYHPVGISAVADLAPKDKVGKAMSVQAIGGSLGVGLAPFVLAFLASIYGWRTPLQILAVAGLPFLLFFLLRTEETKGTKPGRVERIFPKLSLAVAFAIFFFLRAFVFKSITTFLPTYLVEVKGFSLGLGGFTTSILLLPGVFTLPVAGVIADRFDRVLIVVLSSLSSALVLFLVVTYFPSGVLLYVLLISLGVFLYLSFPAILSLVKEVSPGDEYGRTFGINFTMTAASGTVAPVIVGYIGDLFSLGFAFRFLPILLFIAPFSILVVKNRI